MKSSNFITSKARKLTVTSTLHLTSTNLTVKRIWRISKGARRCNLRTSSWHLVLTSASRFKRWPMDFLKSREPWRCKKVLVSGMTRKEIPVQSWITMMRLSNRQRKLSLTHIRYFWKISMVTQSLPMMYQELYEILKTLVKEWLKWQKTVSEKLMFKETYSRPSQVLPLNYKMQRTLSKIHLLDQRGAIRKLIKNLQLLVKLRKLVQLSPKRTRKVLIWALISSVLTTNSEPLKRKQKLKNKNV